MGQGSKPEPNIVTFPSGARPGPPLIRMEGVTLTQGSRRLLEGIDLDIPRTGILSLIGPAGAGQTSLMKAIARLHDGDDRIRLQGRILMDGRDIHGADSNGVTHRRRFGWCGSQPDHLPISIFENLAYGARRHGAGGSRAGLARHVETCLTRTGLWADLRDRVDQTADAVLDDGQQRRLGLARALAGRPDVLLLDDPGQGLDPVATARLGEVLLDLRRDHCLVLAGASLVEAHRLADTVAFMQGGRVIEQTPARVFFGGPATEAARRFVAAQGQGRPSGG